MSGGGVAWFRPMYLAESEQPHPLIQMLALRVKLSNDRSNTTETGRTVTVMQESSGLNGLDMQQLYSGSQDRWNLRSFRFKSVSNRTSRSVRVDVYQPPTTIYKDLLRFYRSCGFFIRNPIKCLYVATHKSALPASSPNHNHERTGQVCM